MYIYIYICCKPAAEVMLAKERDRFMTPQVMIVYPERHLPTPGQHGHSPQRHTAASTTAPTTADTGNTVPQRANPTQTAYP